MRFLKYGLITLLTLGLVSGAGYLYASSGMVSKPGYAKLTMPGWFSTNTQVVLNLGPAGVKPVRWMVNRAIGDSDRELTLSKRVLLSVLEDLQAVQLRVYEVENNRQVFDQAIDDSIATLRQENWQTLLRVQEDNERVVVMQSGSEDLISGLSFLASTPENAVFVNLVGQFSPVAIAEIAESINQTAQQ